MYWMLNTRLGGIYLGECVAAGPRFSSELLSRWKEGEGKSDECEHSHFPLIRMSS
jgi:hypothetical protein